MGNDLGALYHDAGTATYLVQCLKLIVDTRVDVAFTALSLSPEAIVRDPDFVAFFA